MASEAHRSQSEHVESQGDPGSTEKSRNWSSAWPRKIDPEAMTESAGGSRATGPAGAEAFHKRRREPRFPIPASPDVVT
jgi:hypothetical protein